MQTNITRIVFEVINDAIKKGKISESEKGYWINIASHHPGNVVAILSNMPESAIMAHNFNIQSIVNHPNMQNTSIKLNEITNVIDKAITDRKILSTDRSKWINMTKTLQPWEVVDLVSNLPANAIDGQFKPRTISDVMNSINRRGKIDPLNDVTPLAERENLQSIESVMKEISERKK